MTTRGRGRPPKADSAAAAAAAAAAAVSIKEEEEQEKESRSKKSTKTKNTPIKSISVPKQSTPVVSVAAAAAAAQPQPLVVTTTSTVPVVNDREDSVGILDHLLASIVFNGKVMGPGTLLISIFFYLYGKLCETGIGGLMPRNEDASRAAGRSGVIFLTVFCFAFSLFAILAVPSVLIQRILDGVLFQKKVAVTEFCLLATIASLVWYTLHTHSSR